MIKKIVFIALAFFLFTLPVPARELNIRTSPGIATVEEYKDLLKYDLKENWTVPEKNTHRRASVAVFINRDGTLKSYKFIQSSKSKKIDASIGQSIKKTFPYEDLPPEHPKKILEVRIIFDYNVYLGTSVY